MQLPDWHWLLDEQVEPCVNLTTHWLEPLQKSAAIQSGSPAHVDLQVVAPQTYGVHAVVVGAGQLPLEQEAALVWVPAAQLTAEHWLVG
jgi:hypothetical protein